jgi:hypothetical protein
MDYFGGEPTNVNGWENSRKREGMESPSSLGWLLVDTSDHSTVQLFAFNANTKKLGLSANG